MWFQTCHQGVEELATRGSIVRICTRTPHNTLPFHIGSQLRVSWEGWTSEGGDGQSSFLKESVRQAVIAPSKLYLGQTLKLFIKYA